MADETKDPGSRERDERAPHLREATVAIVRRIPAKTRDEETPEEEAAREAEAEDVVEIAISSEAPVERYDWRTGKTYDEVLGHGASEVDLGYAKDGLPFFVNHSSWDMVGLVEGISLDGDRILRGRVRFSKSQRGQEIERDIRDGIRKKISVGYDYDDTNYTETVTDGRAVRRVRGWRPLEASSVPIPADYDVGVGRSARPGARRPDDPPGVPAIKAKENTVEPNTAAPPAADVRAGILAEHREISELAAIHNMRDKLSGWLGQGASLAQVQKEILDAIKERSAKALAAGGEDGPIQFSEREAKEFSFVRALRQLQSGEGGFEREVSAELYKKLGRQPQNQTSMLVPTALLGRFGKVQGQRLEVATSNAGQQLKFTDYGGFLPILRNRMYAQRLGVRTLSGLQGDLAFVSQPSANTLQWGVETATPTATNFGTGLKTMAPKNATALTKYTRQLLFQSVESVEGLVQEDLLLIVALGLDKAVFQGAGSSEPTGVLSASGVNTVTMGTAGAVPTFAKLVDMETEIAADNADVETMGYIATPGIRGYLKQTQQFSGTNGVPIWTVAGQQGYVNGYNAFATNQVPNNLTKGSNTGTNHLVAFGDWSQALIGEWGAVELVVDPYKSKPVIIEVAAHVMADVLFRYPEAFCIMPDARTS
jgi:HK97 family phage major capsid protein